jgi:CPA1 family monovalent cation:H+ antiporter
VDDLELIFALLVAAVLLVRAADRLRVPYPIALVLGGLGLAFVPGMPDVDLEGDIVLLVFIPPLLLSAGWYSSPRELRAESRALGLLALALVMVTMSVVAVAAHALVDGLPWAAAFMLGAVVAPTDAVAAVATFASVRVPDQVNREMVSEQLVQKPCRRAIDAAITEGQAHMTDAQLLQARQDVIVAALVFRGGDIDAKEIFGNVQGGSRPVAQPAPDQRRADCREEIPNSEGETITATK